jgi:hypothetical protein
MTLPLSHFVRGRHAHRDVTARPDVAGSPDHTRWARYFNAMLGLWLFLSAFIWPHVPSARMNTCLVGLFVGVSAVTATCWDEARRLTAVLALWLAFTTVVVYPARPATLWNNLLVAAAVLALSFVHEPSRAQSQR